MAASTQAAPCKHPRATLAATILGSSLAFIDGSVVNVALPTIGHDLQARDAALAWAINAYLLPLGALILTGGAAGDHFGRRRLFLAGVAVFLVASVVCAVAPSFGALLAGRVLQGVGAALLMPNSLAILGAGFEGDARGRAIGTWASVGAIAGALGPLLGGWLVDVVSWRAIFLINLPIGIAAAVLAVGWVPESRDRRRGRPLDVSGALTITLALGLLTWALTAAAEPERSMLPIGVAGFLGAALLAVFVALQSRKGDQAMMPLAMFGTSTFVGVTILTFLLYGALGGLFVLLPFQLINIGGFSATQAGAALLPLPLLIGLGSRWMGTFAARYGGRWPLAIGAAIVAVGMALFLRAGAGPIDYWRDFLPAIMVVSLGLAISVAPLTTTVMAAVDNDHVGAASGFNSAIARIGGLVATALLGFVFAMQASPAALPAGFHNAYLIGAVLAGLAAVGAFGLIKSSPRKGGAAH